MKGEGLATLSGNAEGVNDGSGGLIPGSILARRNLVRARTSLAQLALMDAAWELCG